ncbi:hypothetical protein [Prochlorococcus sp. MIT 0801]|uniref:hypothetical protein n=1 Tax=Prochlorococcus sp. MIT 0801 TaxID=1501269 RepID=UPI0004F80435|nr:hypothetical protein [Prochlorococcus sp. MIT 0801]AIQ97647.1 hypothetical protein EW15_1555 [Prochlorococcus sp. MIT 0801]
MLGQNFRNKLIAKWTKEKGVFTKLLEQGIKILLIKECKKIRNIKIDITSTSTQIIKGEIQKIKISAEDINYKDVFFDELRLESDNLNINFKLTTKELFFTNDPLIEFKISWSQDSLKKILLSKNWNWIGDNISKEILNKEKLIDIKIKNAQLLMRASKKDIDINQDEKINIKTEKGKVYLENKTYNKKIQIPIEDKIYIKNINIENNLINVFASSSISF